MRNTIAVSTGWNNGGLFYLLLLATAISLVSFNSHACSSAELQSQQGIWNLASSSQKKFFRKPASACPVQLEMSCEDSEDSKYSNFFIDEITTDGTPGAQIYFSKVNNVTPGINAISGEKEISTYSPSKRALVSYYKDCGGVLGCLAGYQVRHKVIFQNNEAHFSKLWDDNVDCHYRRAPASL